MRLRLPTILISIIGVGFAAYAFANQGVAVCAAINTLSLTRLVDGTLVESSLSDQNHPASVERLLFEARSRIENTFGAPRSKPIIVFFNDQSPFWPFKLNEYGSTHFLGSRACVIVGPNGQNLDVVAHELMHAEIADRVGHLRRFTQIPVWFDEGLAMQVDFRPRYVHPEGAGAGTKYVKTLSSNSSFFLQNDYLLTQNYASAKAEVALWVTDVGKASVYRELERVRSGEKFYAIVKSQ